MLRFLTVFPQTENIHLIKDVGMIPYVLHKKYGYESTIASYNNGNYPYAETDVKGLKQAFIKRCFNIQILDVCWFLLMNFRKFDVFQCYHISKESIIYLLFFKFLKKITCSKSVVYLKFDSNDLLIKKGLSSKVVFLLKKIDVLSVETKTLYHYLNDERILNGLVNYIPNGFADDKRIDAKFDLKENLIITVGRIGSVEKNNEALLNAFIHFAKINLDWKLELIGPIDLKFQLFIDNYYLENPDLISRVIFTGAIYDRKLLEEKYKKAKIFILTSPIEGFPLVFLEAIKFGCTIISPNFSSAIDVTSNEKYGVLFEVGNYHLLHEKILKATNSPRNTGNYYKQIQDYAYENFSWTKICGDLDALFCRKLNYISKNGCINCNS